MTELTVYNVFFVDDEPNSSPVLTAKMQLIEGGHTLIAEATSRRETIAKISELKLSDIIATLGIIDGLAGQGSEIANLLREAWPDIKTLAFSTSSQSGWSDGWLPKEACRSILFALEDL